MKNYSKGYEDISVEVIDYNKDLARHAWNCYRMTWRELQNVEYDCNNERVKKAITDIALYRALPMPREQAIITFRINNISRVCLAQITRQRKACFNVESQMPRPINHNVIIPLNIFEDKELNDDAMKLVEASQKLYDKCIEKGIPPQDARYVTLHGQTTSCVYVVDINTFVGSFSQRCENNIADEINLVYRLCKRAILNKIEEDYKSNEIDELTWQMYSRIINPADCQGAKQKVCMNYDKVFGNGAKRYPSANEEIEKITENADYDFKKSAWYLELQRLDESLLFKDEKEMIERWKK